MGSKARGTTGGSLASTSRLDDPEAIRKALEAMPNARTLDYPEWHDSIIADYYGVKPAAAIARMLRRSVASVSARAKHLRSLGLTIKRYGSDTLLARQRDEKVLSRVK